MRKTDALLMTCLLVATGGVADAQRFYPDDPLWVEPPPMVVKSLPTRKTDVLYDFLVNSFGKTQVPVTTARGTNTLGEVADSTWFTNRHAKHRMSREELQRGPGTEKPPRAPFQVVGAKTEGITPGFRMKDAGGRLYFVKPDPYSNPEMATAADVIGSRFFYALGYNTPQNYLVNLRISDLNVSEDAHVDGLGGKKRPMLKRDLEDILHKVPQRKDGTYRMLASLAVAGKPIGPFRYEGTREDDPNDTVPHELRRELRGLAVLCAWLNHTDSKSINSLDTFIEEKGLAYVRHHLIDFGAAFGSDSDMPKNARFGNEYVIPEPREALLSMASFGLMVRPWESADYGPYKAVGRFEAKTFDPLKWKGNYPNPAFLRRQPEDEYWAAKLVMAFRDEDIRAIVETAEYSDPKVTEYMTRTLSERRDKVGRAYFARVAPLDNFAVSDGKVRFDDLAVKHGFAPAREWEASWFTFDNRAGKETPIAGATGTQVPAAALDHAYCGVRFASAKLPGLAVKVFLRKSASGFDVVGVERTTSPR